MKKIIILVLLFSMQWCFSQTKKVMEPEIKKTDAEWKASLTEEQYQVLRKKGTERAYTGAYWDHFEKGK